MVRIPSEYQEVEYIESTGTQYIDTGYSPVLSPILKMKIRITNRDDYDIAGFVSNVYPSFIIDAAPAQSRWYNRYGNTAAYGVDPAPVVGQIQEWEWGKEVKFNGNLVRTNTECDWSSNTQKMNIFSGRNKARVAIYSCSLYDGELVRNFIPCYRKSDNEIGMYDTVTGTFFTNQGTGTFLKGNDVTYDTVNLMESRRRILLNTPHIESLTGSMLSFKTDMASKLKECRVYFTPIQEGTGDPSPDNVRPIVGWDGVTITRCGKNLFDKDAMTKNYGYLDSTGKWVDVTQRSGCKVTEYIQINGSIVYDGITTPGNAPYCVWYDSNKNIISTFEAQIGRTIVVPPNNAQFVRFSVIQQPQNNIYDQDSFVLFDSTLEIQIPFPQTIYGGYVDLVKGEVVEEWASIASYGGETLPGRWMSDRDVYSAGTIPTTGAQVIYELATPNAYPLTPQTIKTLRGINNVWSDANGDIDIKYWTH